jgi:hypothetical protein
MAHRNGKLFCHSDEQPHVLIIIACSSLEEDANKTTKLLPPTNPSDKDSAEASPFIREEEISKHHIFLSDGWNFYVLRQKATTSEIFVDVYDAQNPSKYERRIPLLNTGKQPFVGISAERFPMGCYLTNGWYLMAVVPQVQNSPQSSPEECAGMEVIVVACNTSSHDLEFGNWRMCKNSG